jgi:hypothetical protein
VSDKLVAFLYLLGRDHLAIGRMNGVALELEKAGELDFDFSDPDLESWARRTSHRLTGEPTELPHPPREPGQADVKVSWLPDDALPGQRNSVTCDALLAVTMLHAQQGIEPRLAWEAIEQVRANGAPRTVEGIEGPYRIELAG